VPLPEGKGAGPVHELPPREVVFSLITCYFLRFGEGEGVPDHTVIGGDWEVVIVDAVGRVRGCDEVGAGIEHEIQHWPVRVRLSPHFLGELNLVCEVLAGLPHGSWIDDEPTRGHESIEVTYRDGRSCRVSAHVPVFQLFSRVLRPSI
jgi:hypothetical protein